MIDLIFSLSNPISQVQLLAQAQSPSYYLPIATTQSVRANCTTYTATNTTGRPIRDVFLNRRNSKGQITQYPVWRFAADGILKNGEKVRFDMCDNTFVNVEAKQ
ncbi:MAG: hypothetical protein AUK48_00890 [Oscillatoriales cyanobacterium CG2_30_44_21]|nr:MAG: hypothetical protein AUK48_00890 [Oscillatoriales cyanobacterium CG2_30_44_21]